MSTRPSNSRSPTAGHLTGEGVRLRLSRFGVAVLDGKQASVDGGFGWLTGRVGAYDNGGVPKLTAAAIGASSQYPSPHPLTMQLRRR